MDALPGQVLTGVVTEIAAAAANQQGVVTDPVRVQVQVTEGLQLRDGLSAVANVVLDQRLNVLLVPQQAIFGSFQAPMVKVQTDSGIVDRPVALGATDDCLTEVREGLQESDRVVVQNSLASSSPFGGGGFRSFSSGGGGVIIRGGPR